jgi:anti-sigma B factor antagonist
MTLGPLHVETAGDLTVVLLTEEALLDADEEALVERLDALAGGPGRRLHLDLSGVHYLGSTGLSQLVRVHRRLQARGGGVILVNVPNRVFEVLKLTRLDSVLEVRRLAGP